MTSISADVEPIAVEAGRETALRTITCVLLIVGAALVANLNALFGGFVWDDGVLITTNTLIKHWNTLPELFTQTFLTSYYRPVVMLSFAAEYALWGLKPFGFHLTSLLLHAANAILAFVILKRVSRSSDAAFLGALLFAVHPAHKGVVYIADRTGILSAFFFLGSVILYMGYRESENRRKAWARYGASLALCALALFSKEEALMLPVVIIMTDLFLYPEQMKRDRMSGAALYAPFLALAILYLLVRASVAEPVSGILAVFAVEPVRRLLTIPRIVLDYFVLAVFPLRLDLNPRTPLATGGPELATWGAAAVLLLLVAAIPWLSRRSRPLAFGALWFLVVFIPMSNIIPIFPEVADTELFTPIHFLYLPSVGIFLCAGCGLTKMLDRFNGAGIAFLHRRGALLCVVWIVMAFSFLSIERNTIWKDEITLFEHMIRRHPENAGAHVNLGNAYSNAGRPKEALKEFEIATALEPDTAETHNSLGLAWLETGLIDRAIEEFRESIRLKPNDSGSYGNLAVAYAQKGRLTEAVAAGEAAVALNPSGSETRTNLGLIYMRAGRLGDAETQFLAALDNDSDDAEAHNALGSLYMLQQEYGKAGQHWERALLIRPDHTKARENLDNLNRKLR